MHFYAHSLLRQYIILHTPTHTPIGNPIENFKKNALRKLVLSGSCEQRVVWEGWCWFNFIYPVCDGISVCFYLYTCTHIGCGKSRFTVVTMQNRIYPCIIIIY